MSSEAIRPSSLDGIKRLAKSIKGERGIQHIRALDAAAQSAGFQNFRHASNALSKATPPASLRFAHSIFVTVYWRDRKAGGSGRETLTVGLTVPWSELVTRDQFENHTALADFRAEGPDHLARRHLVQSQSQARRVSCAAARALQFMDATRLRPSKSYSRAYPDGRSINAVPGQDHSSIWYDRASKRYLLADEPYDPAAKSKAAERAAWAQRHGFVVVKPAWPGMYNPDGGSRLYLIADAEKGISLEPIAAALDKLPPPIVEETWNGESAPTVPIFVSPGSIAKANIARDQPQVRQKSNSRGNSIGYVQTFVGPRRRPKGRMPIDAHAEVGRILKSVLTETFYRKGVYNRIDSIRSELDEWTQREYSHGELPNEQFFDLYYGDSGSTYSRSLSEAARERHVDGLDKVKRLLVAHYPDCVPLRALLKKIDAAIDSVQRWAS